MSDRYYNRFLGSPNAAAAAPSEDNEDDIRQHAEQYARSGLDVRGPSMSTDAVDRLCFLEDMADDELLSAVVDRPLLMKKIMMLMPDQDVLQDVKDKPFLHRQIIKASHPRLLLKFFLEAVHAKVFSLPQIQSIQKDLYKASRSG
ncbi:hypothetical protein SEMRO_1142_G245730.1 [Seminavis robusta]|uniref:Uncharacterized protein n=1 Tax=Seminavis robusta TaxID=568900 RepID=A0A9N8EGT5_9STRA|nr:hypothetical protein SEMRO_1142_G245730.1 [Seminavis robusta]|eukprot:Sro1142_g245730.1 n/a (145) ;mRNA; r:1112-1546